MHNAPIEGHYLEHQSYLSPRGPAPFSPIQMKTSSSNTSWLHRSNSGNVASPSTKPSIGAPLLGCIFFLDMANDDARKLSTERQLKQLAARVEDLFNGDVVTHVITTRHLTHEQKLKIQQQALSPPPPSLSSSSPASAFLPVATTTATSTPGLSSPSLLASPHPSSSSQAMTVSPFASTLQPLTTSTSSTSTLLSPPTLGISNAATASTSPNSPFSSSPSSPFSCNPAAGSYPPPQASSSPSSPSAMAAYAPPSTAGGAPLRPPTPLGNAALPAPAAPHSLIEQLRYASGSGKRKESQLAMTRKAYMVAHQQQPVQQAADTELSEDVIALAYRLGKKIYHIDKFAPWLEKHCSPYGSAMATTTTTSVPRRGNESTHTTAESPIGSPQGQRNLSANCQSTAAGPAWSTASVDMLPSLSAATAAAPFAPVMVVPSSLPPFPSGLPASSASTTGVAPTTTTTKPPSPTALPSFQAPFLMVEDLKGQFKTMYKEFPFDSYGCSTVPFLNLDAPPGCSPFLDSETIKKHKEMQRQYQQKLEQRKREKPAAGRPKRPTSAPLTRPRRPSHRERSPPQAAMQESVDMWEGEDGGGMADSSLQVPHPFRAPAANPTTSPGSGLVLYPPSTSSSSSVVSLSSSSSSSVYQQRRLSPLSSLSASSPYCPMSSTRTSPTFAFPPLHSSAPSFHTTGTTGTPRPSSKMSSSGGSHQHVRAHSHSHGSLASASLLARAHHPSDWRERLSASCLPPDSSGRSLGEEMEDDAATATFMQRSA